MDIPSTTFTNNGNARTSNNESFGGLNDMNSSLVNAIMMAMQSQQPSGGNMEISLEMNARKVAEIVIKEVNKITRQTGTIPLKL